MSLRRLLPFHRWAALTFGLITLLSAATGAGMAFRKQLEPLVYPRTPRAECAAPVGLDDVLAGARMLHPAGEVDYLRVHRDVREPIAVRWMNKDTLYIDRCSGQLVASQNRYGGFFGLLEWIHRGQWLPDPAGELVMGMGATTLLILLLGIGLYLWWPRKGRRLRDGFRLNRKLRRGPPFDMGLHRTVGAWAALPLAISALTGLPNAFPMVHDAIVSLDSAPRAVKPRSVVGGSMKLAAAWRVIERLTPNPREVLIHVARKPVDPLEIYIIAADAPHANARTYLFLDSGNGSVLRFTPYAQMRLGSRIYYWMLSIHTGEVGGPIAQLFLFLGALGALVLGFTGIRTWFRRRANRARNATARNGGKQTAPAFAVRNPIE
jgi:vanillate O-demethylase ferredoxin subunit